MSKHDTELDRLEVGIEFNEGEHTSHEWGFLTKESKTKLIQWRDTHTEKMANIALAQGFDQFRYEMMMLAGDRKRKTIDIETIEKWGKTKGGTVAQLTTEAKDNE